MLGLCGAIVIAGIVAGVLVSMSAPVTVVIQSSNSKQRWLTDAIALFNAKAFHTSEGRRIGEPNPVLPRGQPPPTAAAPSCNLHCCFAG